jgi:hypothetical protein
MKAEKMMLAGAIKSIAFGGTPAIFAIDSAPGIPSPAGVARAENLLH